MRAGVLSGPLAVDGRLDEAAWQTAEAVESFTQVEPDEGEPATVHTIARVIASPSAVAIGIVCDDPEPGGIVSFSVRRDAPLGSEDHVRVVLGPFMDGRSGYVFAVNPSGARYDGLVEPGGESDNPQWDGIWEAAVQRHANGWSAEIYIPVQTLSFASGLRQWHFNVQRRLQRRLETSRWASPAR
ncbi:MAG TPA: carbohydrate binding family 9 domain-containing protein, partial [Vicinamibacterales bacterium]|nr:carbohydrate binding family 9 domain-containing protein [Vicinamibacterales bacterium]